MSIARDNHTNDIVVGAGEIYIDLLDDDLNTTGERYIGDSTGATISVETEQTTVFSGDGPTARKLVDFVRSVSHTMSCAVHDMSADNLALFLAGAAEDVAVGARVSAEETVTTEAVQGRWYQLGVSAALPAGYPRITAAGFAAKGGANGTTAAAAGADFKLDAGRGRIYIVPGSGKIQDGHTLKVTYAAPAVKVRRAKAGAARQVRAAVRYIEDASAGKGTNWYIRQASVGASGEIALKSRDGEQQITLSILVEEPSDGTPSILADGQPA